MTFVQNRVQLQVADMTRSGMRSDVRDVLKRWLGEDARAIDVLSDTELTQLHDVMAAAKESQAKALAAASEEAMRQMPAVLRQGIGRILGR